MDPRSKLLAEKAAERNGHDHHFDDLPADPPEMPEDIRAMLINDHGPEGVNGFSDGARGIAAPIRELNQDAARREPGDESEGVPRTKDGFVKEFVDPFEGNRVTFRTLRQQHPKLHDPVIDGILRAGETLNLISVSKIGKSWMMYGLLLSIVTGRDWLGFPTTQGRCLLIDNELHKPTLANRIRTVADAMGISEEDYADDLEIWSQRGELKDIFGIVEALKDREFTQRDYYRFIGLDAKYRAIPAGASENANEAETQFYNSVDQLGMLLHAAVGMVHHSTKGDQGGKRVTDVGSGGGAQSRAADAHLILREHEEEGIIVLEAAIRSFKPIEPIALRWEFPLWLPTDDVDIERIKGRGTPGEEKQAVRDSESDSEILDLCQTWKTRKEIKAATGYGDGRRDRAIARLLKAKLLEPGTEDRPRNPGTEVFRKTIHAR